MHIMHVTDLYRPVVGGLENHVATISREFIRLGHRVSLITVGTGTLPEFEDVDGVRVHRIRGWGRALARLHDDPQRPFPPSAPDPGMTWAMREIIRRERPDVVHSHGWIRYSYAPLHRAESGPAHIAVLHDYGLTCAKRTYQYKDATCEGPAPAKCVSCCAERYGRLKGTALATGLLASRPLNRRADAYVATGSVVAEVARTALPAGMQISVIPAAVPDDLDPVVAAAPRPGFLPPDDGFLLYAGALGRHKGTDILLEAHRRMRRRVALVVIGASTGEGERFDFSAPEVHVIAPRTHLEVLAAWPHCSVAVVPSTWQEPLGLVALEAMRARRPVVASAVGGLRDTVVHGVTGLLVPPGDPAALAAALDDLLEDPARRDRMGEAGRRRARAFEAHAVAPRLLALSAAVLERRRAGAGR
jgi:glycosyltransferase involved in cell wall biosynthesis